MKSIAIFDWLYRSPINRKLYFNILTNNTSGYILSDHFELSDQYVVKMAELCQSKGVKFHLYPAPVSDEKQESVEMLKESFVNSKTYRINPKYFDMVHYFPAEQAPDGRHFAGAYANQEAYNEKIQEYYAGEELLAYLRFS